MASLDPTALKRERKTAGLTQKELAKRSGVAYSTLTKLEQGKIPSPSVTAMQDLAEALHCTVADLISAETPKLKANEHIKFVYFDIGGVLVHWLPSVHSFAERINRPYDAVLKLFYEYNTAVCRGNMTSEEFKLLCALKLNTEADDTGQKNTLKSWVDDMRPVLPTHAFLRELSKVHAVGLLSNIGKGYYDEFIERKLVPNLKYKTIVRSCDLGLIKPEPQIYDAATQVAGVAPEEVLFIDDSKVNINAAREFGWNAEWFDEYQPQQSIARISRAYFH